VTEELNKKSDEDLANFDLSNRTEQKLSLASNRIAPKVVAEKLDFSLYEKDFVAWSDEQALLLEQQRYEELDLANLVEEVKDLGNRHRDAIEIQLTRLLMHLLKWHYQEEKRSSWLGTIKEARKQIGRLIRKYPVLAVHIETVLPECYMDAKEDAADETGLPLKIFPLACPYWLKDQVLNPNFLPTK
jgi:hypothetical protein